MKTLLALILCGGALGCQSPQLDAKAPAAPHGKSWSVGHGFVSLELPEDLLIGIDQAGKPTAPRVTSRLRKPPTSNKFWSSLIWKHDPKNQFSRPIYAHPWVAQTSSRGLGLSYPDVPVVSPREYRFPFREELTVSLTGLELTESSVSDYSDWTVTADLGGALSLTIGHGLPFIYGRRHSQKPLTIDWPGALEGSAKVDAKVPERLVVNIAGHRFAAFIPLGARWEPHPGGFHSDLGGRDFFSIAVLPDTQEETLQLFTEHAYAFVRDTRVVYRLNPELGSVTSRFEVVSAPMERRTKEHSWIQETPLLAAYPHQWKHSASPFLDLSYASPRGRMKLIQGSVFETSHALGPILPSLPLYNPSDRSTLLSLLEEEAAREPFLRGLGEVPDHDTYWEGKSMGRLSNLIELAEILGQTDLRSQMVSALRERLEDWLDGQAPRHFIYDAKWRSLIGVPASYGSSKELNDHHFHMGYFVRAAATVARFDEQFLANYGGAVELLIQDAANPDRSDERFPFLRHMDVFAGHSWANGPAQFDDGNNEESSSEDLNFSSAVLLWGSTARNTAFRDLGAFLYAEQVAAAQEYWFDVDNSTFPNDFAHPTVAMVWGSGGRYDTWFDQDPTVIHAINYLPFTGSSLYLGLRPEYVRQNFDTLLSRSHGEITTWRDYVLMFLATAEPKRARELFDADPYFEPEFGNSKAFTLHFLSSLQAVGRPSKATCRGTWQAVFETAAERHYLLFNPEKGPKTFTCSDGAQFQVPPRSGFHGSRPLSKTKAE